MSPGAGQRSAISGASERKGFWSIMPARMPACKQKIRKAPGKGSLQCKRKSFQDDRFWVKRNQHVNFLLKKPSKCQVGTCTTCFPSSQADTCTNRQPSAVRVPGRPLLRVLKNRRLRAPGKGSLECRRISFQVDCFWVTTKSTC